MSECVKRYFDGVGETRDVIADDTAGYFGVILEENWLTLKETRGSAGVNPLVRLMPRTRIDVPDPSWV